MRIVKDFEQVGFGCPSAWRFVTDGDAQVYVRYRWGVLSVRVNNRLIYSERIGDDLDGVIAWSEVEPIIGRL